MGYTLPGLEMPLSILEIIFLHYVARSFCETTKLPQEVPKIAKCLKLRYSVHFIKRKKQGMKLYPLAGFLFFMLIISDVYYRDGAKRPHNFRQFSAF